MTPPAAPLGVYLDEDVDVLLAPLLAAHGIDCLTTLAAGNLRLSDAEQLAFAHQESRVLITHNRTDFESLAISWWRQQRDHSGLCWPCAAPTPMTWLDTSCPSCSSTTRRAGATRYSTRNV